MVSYEAVEFMQQYGGSFVQALAEAWYKADHRNKKVLEESFHYFREYEEKLKRYKNDN